MKISPSKMNTFLFFKLPSAWWSGVRVKSINEKECIVSVRHKWFNQNPFKSLYFAVQAMSAELSTGALVMFAIKNSGQNISMLVARNKSEFTKKATGRITFVCNQGEELKQVIQKAIETKEGQTLWMTSIGTDEKGDQVSKMEFEWTLKVRS